MKVYLQIMVIPLLVLACSNKGNSSSSPDSATPVDSSPQITNFALNVNRGFLQTTWDTYAVTPAPAKYVLRIGYSSGNYIISHDINYGTNWADVGDLNTTGSAFAKITAVNSSNEVIASSPEHSGSLASLLADNAEADDAVGSAKEISLGNPKWRSLHLNNDEDFFVVNFTADPAGVVIETSTGSGACSLDTRLYLYGNSGASQLAMNDQGPGISPCSRITVGSGLGAGTYHIKVNSYNSNFSGAYRLSVTSP